MPLRSGSSQEVISANIAELVKAGHEQKQAEAIAEHKARGDAETRFDGMGIGDKVKMGGRVGRVQGWELPAEGQDHWALIGGKPGTKVLAMIVAFEDGRTEHVPFNKLTKIGSRFDSDTERLNGSEDMGHLNGAKLGVHGMGPTRVIPDELAAALKVGSDSVMANIGRIDAKLKGLEAQARKDAQALPEWSARTSVDELKRILTLAKRYLSAEKDEAIKEYYTDAIDALEDMISVRSKSTRNDASGMTTKGLTVEQVCRALKNNGHTLNPDMVRSMTYVGEERDGSRYTMRFKEHDHTGHVYVFISDGKLKASLVT